MDHKTKASETMGDLDEKEMSDYADDDKLPTNSLNFGRKNPRDMEPEDKSKTWPYCNIVNRETALKMLVGKIKPGPET